MVARIAKALPLVAFVLAGPAALEPAGASTPYLVKDINPAGSSGPSWLENVGGALLFQADDGASGAEPWMSDGTAAGTVRLKDIRVGSQASYPSGFTGADGAIYFAANNGSLGAELWRSDGTEAGTMLVKDINPGAADSWPGSGVPLTVVNGTLYFKAYTNAAGYELWKSDGLAAGTALVKDIGLGSAGSSPLDLVDLNGTLLFRADDGLPSTNHRELWRSDGTAGGTAIVKDIKPAGEGYPQELTAMNGVLFFSADDGTNGRELWRSDGTEAGTVLVKDIHPSGGSQPNQLLVFDGTLYFTANDGAGGTELWKSDGSAGGTVMVVDLNPSGGSAITRLTAVGNNLFFTIVDGPFSAQLWRSDGTAAGTIMLKEFVPNDYHPVVEELTDVGGVLYFAANDGVHGVELWRSDGTPEGTVLAADINAGDEWSFSYPRSLTDVSGTLFFSADDGVNGFELWAIDGAAFTGVPGGADPGGLLELTVLPAAPNPFRLVTTLRFELSDPAPVRLRIFDAAGREVRTLISGARLPAGRQAAVWDGRDDRGRDLGSGVFVYRVDAGGASGAGRAVLTR